MNAIRQPSPELITLPHNTEIEAALLGAILVDNRAYDRVSDFLRPEHFYEPVLGRIYEACGKLINNNQSASPQTLAHRFENDEALTDVGGAAYLFDLASSVVTIINAGQYGRDILDLWKRRQIAVIGEEIKADALDGDPDVSAETLREAAEERLAKLSGDTFEAKGPCSIRDALERALEQNSRAVKMKRDGKVVGIPTGLTKIDRLIGGLQRGNLYVVAGRPGMGKSNLAGSATYNATTAGYRVLFDSLEMPKEQLAQRLLASATGIPVQRMHQGDITEEEEARLIEAAPKLYRLPYDIDDQGGMNLAQIRSRARRHKRSKRGLDLLIVDYLQLVQAPPGMPRGTNRVQEIAAITTGLKQLARDLEIAVLALSQLSRQVEQREDKRPMLSDLRESGAIEQDADVVMFLYREEYYLSKEKPVQGARETDQQYNEKVDRWERRKLDAAGKSEAIIAKNRHGPEDTVLLRFDGVGSRFLDWGQERFV